MTDCSGDADERRAGRQRGGSTEDSAGVANNNGERRSARGSADAASRRRPLAGKKGGAATAIMPSRGQKKMGWSVGDTRHGKARHAASGPHRSCARQLNNTRGRGGSVTAKARQGNTVGKRINRRCSVHTPTDTVARPQGMHPVASWPTRTSTDAAVSPLATLLMARPTRDAIQKAGACPLT